MNGSDFGRIGQAIGDVILWGVVALIIAVPLAIWKVIDIALWIASHVRWV